MIKDFINKIYSFKIKEKLFFNPFIGFEISSLGNYQGVNSGIKRTVPVIVSLHAKPSDYKNLPITLYSLLNQTMKPDKIILWINEDENLQTLPYEITQFIKNGLEIKFIKNKNEYTATYYAIKEFSNSINVIAQNGLHYSKNWLKKLYSSYIQYSDEIQVHLANEVILKDENLLPSKFWKKSIEGKSSYSYVINLQGGVLFPPNCFGKDFLRKDIFLKYAPANPELWLWVMSLVYGKKTRIVKNNNKHLCFLNIMQLLNTKTDYELIDKQIESLMKFYRQNITSKLL